MNTNLLDTLQQQMEMKLPGGIYHKIQIELTYNSNHIEGSRLTLDQTRYIFETNTIGAGQQNIKVDDVIETSNHFRCIDLILREAKTELNESQIKELHKILKSSTSHSAQSWFKVGDYKALPNEVGGNATTAPEEVATEMRQLLEQYNSKPQKTIEDIIDFHHQFEAIHPFQDGNGRVGRLIMFKECLAHELTPFIITDEIKMFYYRGLQNWPTVKEYLLDTCLSAQDDFRLTLDYFRIK